MGATTLKLPEEMVAQLGGATAAEERIKSLLASEKAGTDLRAEIGKIVQLCEANGNSMKAFEERLKSAEATIAKPPMATLSEEQVKTVTAQAEESAKLAAAKEVSAAIAKAGQSALGSSNATTEKTTAAAPTGPGSTDAEMDAYWAAHPELQKDFVDVKSWRAYTKAEAEGRVSLHKSRN